MSKVRRWQVGGRPIIILGHGRSGTSWVGRILSAARRVLYYFEPMHPTKMGRPALSNWFRYARPGEEDAELAKAFDPVFGGFDSPAKAWNRSGWHRWVPGYRVVVKDVASLMAAEWLYARYAPELVLIVRHPCAVIVSELQQGTASGESLRTLLGQEALVEEHLRPYVAVLDRADSPIEQLAAVWAARHRVVADGYERHSNWHVVYYEALCADPAGEYRRLFDRLRLRWSPEMADYVDQHSTVDDPGAYATRKVSRDQIDGWKRHVTGRDAAKVREICAALEVPFYASNESWYLARFLS